MADVEVKSAPGSKPNKQRRRSTRIDMTAMVDVAFLLLTFFILTTVLVEPRMMEVNKPPVEGTSKVSEQKILTIMLGADDSVYYWQGSDVDQARSARFEDAGVRNVILAHLNRYPKICGPNELPSQTRCWDPIFVLKSSPDAKYGAFVDLLDEMEICAARKYAIADFSDHDKELMERLASR